MEHPHLRLLNMTPPLSATSSLFETCHFQAVFHVFRGLFEGVNRGILMYLRTCHLEGGFDSDLLSQRRLKPWIQRGCSIFRTCVISTTTSTSQTFEHDPSLTATSSTCLWCYRSSLFWRPHFSFFAHPSSHSCSDHRPHPVGHMSWRIQVPILTLVLFRSMLWLQICLNNWCICIVWCEWWLSIHAQLTMHTWLDKYANDVIVNVKHER